MTILVTGPRGFVATHLIKRLKTEGHDVFYQGRDSWPPVRTDVIINCAAELTNELDMFESNVGLARRLLDLVHEQGIRKVIQIGSSSEYGLTNEPRVESLACTPSNIYEATKLAATALCQGYAARYDLDICVARPFSLYGSGDKPRKLIPTLYRSFISHQPINLFAGAHDWTYIDDFIDGLVLLLNASRAQTKGQIFNFGTGVSSTNDQVVEALESALGGKLSVMRQTDGRYHAHDVDNWVADATKVRTILGWQPKYDLTQGMKAYVMAEWFKEDRG